MLTNEKNKGLQVKLEEGEKGTHFTFRTEHAFKNQH